MQLLALLLTSRASEFMPRCRWVTQSMLKLYVSWIDVLQPSNLGSKNTIDRLCPQCLRTFRYTVLQIKIRIYNKVVTALFL